MFVSNILDLAQKKEKGLVCLYSSSFYWITWPSLYMHNKNYNLTTFEMVLGVYCQLLSYFVSSLALLEGGYILKKEQPSL